MDHLPYDPRANEACYSDRFPGLGNRRVTASFDACSSSGVRRLLPLFQIRVTADNASRLALITSSDLFGFAFDSVFGAPWRPKRGIAEIDLRRAVSASYYALFHRLAEASARVFRAGGPLVERQAVRAFDHGTMRKVCNAYGTRGSRPFPPLESFTAHLPDERLAQIASLFSELQEARYLADYNLAAAFEQDFAADLVSRTQTALEDFTEIADLPETHAFLTALLLADRWTRRG